MDNLDDDIMRLSESLGLSQSEMRLNLGVLEPPAQASDNVLNSLAEMFPLIPRQEIRAALEENAGNSDRAAEQLLSWEALRPDIETVNEIGSRKLRKAAKVARKERQRMRRSSETEAKEVASLAEILGVPVNEARQLYFKHGCSVTDSVLAKCSTTTTAMPTNQRQAVATMESRNEYSGLSTRELQRRLDDVDRQLNIVKERARQYGTNPMTRSLSAESYRDLRELVAERRDVERALNCETFFKTAVYSQHQIDLHGLSLATAKSVCHDIILDFKSSDLTTMEVVTGAGRHSATGRSVIKEWLRGYLKAEGVRAEELEGSFVLHKKKII